MCFEAAGLPAGRMARGDDFEQVKEQQQGAVLVEHVWLDQAPPSPLVGEGRLIVSGSAPGSVIDVLTLPHAEYTAVFSERLEGLRQRLASYFGEGAARFVIVDAQRVERPGARLLGILHHAAGELRRHNRLLVLIGDLCGLVGISRLEAVCKLMPSRESAIAWCDARLDAEMAACH